LVVVDYFLAGWAKDLSASALICLFTIDQMLPRPATPGGALLMQQNNMLFQEIYVSLQNEHALYVAWKNDLGEN
jgi:hypothetical protein